MTLHTNTILQDDRPDQGHHEQEVMMMMMVNYSSTHWCCTLHCTVPQGNLTNPGHQEAMMMMILNYSLVLHSPWGQSARPGTPGGGHLSLHLRSLHLPTLCQRVQVTWCDVFEEVVQLCPRARCINGAKTWFSLSQNHKPANVALPWIGWRGKYMHLLVKFRHITS